MQWISAVCAWASVHKFAPAQKALVSSHDWHLQGGVEVMFFLVPCRHKHDGHKDDRH